MSLASAARAAPLDQRVIVKFLDPDKVSPGGIHLPAMAQKRRGRGDRARVLAVGPGKMFRTGVRRPAEVKVGDIVLVGEYTTIQIEMEEGTCHVVDEEEILAIEENA